MVKGRLTLDVEPHDTRVVHIRTLLDRPQLIGISRHISGSYSVLEQSWDGGNNRLHGVSETIAGEPYAIWINVPERFRVARIRAVRQGRGELPVAKEVTGGTLMMRFGGQSQPVEWEAQFELAGRTGAPSAAK